MKTIKVKIHYKSNILKFFFPKYISGVTIKNHIFFRNSKDEISETLMNHELIHICQYLEQGTFKFLWKYFWKEKNLSYKEKSFEKEAYENEKNLNYVHERWPQYQVQKSY